MLDRGSQLSANLGALGNSLRANAERLLRDVQAAHRQLSEDLERAAPSSESDVRAGNGRRGAELPEPDADIDVPEFVPGSGRRR